MRLKIRKKIIRLKTYFDLLKGRCLHNTGGLEEIINFVRVVNKRSVAPILSNFGAHIGENCDIETGIFIHSASKNFSNLIIKNSCHIGKDVLLDLKAPILINKRSTISMRTTILTHTDVGFAGPFENIRSPSCEKVEIGPGVYIGAGAIILPGVKIGAGSVVGAGALVNKSVQEGSLVAGIPARTIKKLNFM